MSTFIVGRLLPEVSKNYFAFIFKVTQSKELFLLDELTPKLTVLRSSE